MSSLELGQDLGFRVYPVMFLSACHRCCSDLRLLAVNHSPNGPLLTGDRHQPGQPPPFLFSCSCSVRVFVLQVYYCVWGSPFFGRCYYGYRWWSTQPKPSIAPSSFSFLLFTTRVSGSRVRVLFGAPVAASPAVLPCRCHRSTADCMVHSPPSLSLSLSLA